MYPTLFEISLGSIKLPLHTYGFMIAIGFLLAIRAVRKLSLKNNINPELTSDLSFWLLMYGFIGARVLFVITRLDFFIQNPIEIFKVWEGGLVFFGGLIASTAYSIFFFKKHKLSPWKMIDVLSPGVVLAHAFGRLGCLGAGCCYGRPTSLPWGIKLNSELVDITMRGIPLHPTQIYESLSLMLLFLSLMFISKNKKFDGQVGLTYFMVYPVIRSFIEVFRGDTIRGFIIDSFLSTSQFISILVFISALVVLQYRMKKTLDQHAKR
jgi:phosphatidylglycerol:prolipoprotein diacylglycerol transferase